MKKLFFCVVVLIGIMSFMQAEIRIEDSSLAALKDALVKVDLAQRFKNYVDSKHRQVSRLEGQVPGGYEGPAIKEVGEVKHTADLAQNAYDNAVAEFIKTAEAYFNK